MDYRRAALVSKRQHQQQAMTNAHIYASFAGDGPHHCIHGLYDIPTMWWDEERIEATVTRQLVTSKLLPEEQLHLDEPLKYGEGLTDDTYMERIESKAKRIFLILVDAGVPDQIFGIIDDSWDDDDLPIPLDQVERLHLTRFGDEKVDKKFFTRQFVYLLRNVQRGELVVYEDEEVVPLEPVEKKAVGAVTGLIHSNVDKVNLPGRPDDIFLRRRIPLGTTAGHLPYEDFLSGVEAMKAIDHDHLMSLWASYIHQDSGYLLLTPMNDSTLKSVLNVTPQSIKILAKQDRRVLQLNWIHCLADALSFLHGRGLSHGNIKPSNVMLNADNHIFLGDSGVFPTNLCGSGKKGFDKEMYDYSAPEERLQQSTISPTSLPTARQPQPHSNPSGSRRATGPSYGPTPSVRDSVYSVNDASSIYTSSTGSGTPSSPTPTKRQSMSRHDPQKSDIFSLGCIFLEIITMLLKYTSRKFLDHRAAKNKTPGRGGGLPDSSFHKNLGQVSSWIKSLTRESGKKEDKIFRGVDRMILLIEQMLNPNPDERPAASDVQEKLYLILVQDCQIGSTAESPGKIHCEPRQQEVSNFDFGFDQLRLASQRAAAEACANVMNSSSVGANGGTLGVNGGVIYGIEKQQSVVSAAGWDAISPMSPMSPMSPVPRTEFGRELHTKDGDGESVSSSRSPSSQGKSRNGSAGGIGTPSTKIKPKAKAWQAPVYAELSFG